MENLLDTYFPGDHSNHGVHSGESMMISICPRQELFQTPSTSQVSSFPISTPTTKSKQVTVKKGKKLTFLSYHMWSLIELLNWLPFIIDTTSHRR